MARVPPASGGAATTGGFRCATSGTGLMIRGDHAERKTLVRDSGPLSEARFPPKSRDNQQSKTSKSTPPLQLPALHETFRSTTEQWFPVSVTRIETCGRHSGRAHQARRVAGAPSFKPCDMAPHQTSVIDCGRSFRSGCAF